MNKAMMSNLPDDASAKAYLLQAARELMTEQVFAPTNETDIMTWLEANVAATADRAKELQFEMYLKYLKYQGDITAMISEQVYTEIRRVVAK